MCLELALEGERLCKSGDCRAGVAFFQVSLYHLQENDFYGVDIHEQHVASHSKY